MKNYPLFDPGIHFEELHHDHTTWLTELDFYKKEIRFFESLLERRIDSEGSLTNSALIEQFQNKFILQRKWISSAIKEIQQDEIKLKQFINEHLNTIEFMSFGEPKVRRDQMTTNRKIYFDLKHDFFQFMSSKKNNL